MTYAGLTTADKGALMEAKARGAEWVARDSEDQANELMAYYCKPKKHSELGVWLVDQDDILRSSIFLSVNDMPFVQWSDAEPVNIDLALAQIAEMESKQNNLLSEKASEKPCMTWNERINQMTVEEKAKYFVMRKWVGGSNCYISIDNSIHERRSAAESRNRKHLKSPYTEGETK